MGSQAGSSSQGTAVEQGNLKRDVDPVASTGATHNGAGVDRQAFSAALISVLVGAETGSPTSKTVNSTLQHSADNITFANAVAALGLTVAITEITADSQIAEMGGDLSTLNRYIRTQIVTAFVGGSSPTIPVSAGCVLTGADRNPA